MQILHVWYCGHCGAEVPDEYDYCTFCTDSEDYEVK